MSIFMFSGLPGSGKSYHIVRDVILPALLRGRKIFTNIPLNMGNIDALTDVEVFSCSELITVIDEEFIRLLPEKIEEMRGHILIIDEVQNYFISSKAIYNEALVKFFTMHRHFGMDIILATQNIENVTKIVRNLIEVDWKFISQKTKGKLLKNKYVIELYLRGSEFPYQKTAHTYDPKVFPLYQSFDIETEKKGAVEKPVVEENTSLVRYGVGVVVLIIIVFFAITNVIGTFESGNEEAIEALRATSEPETNELAPTHSSSSFVTDLPPSSSESVSPDAPVLTVVNERGALVKIPFPVKVTGITKIGGSYIYYLQTSSSRVTAYSKSDKFWRVGQVLSE